ncbi:hypothetical protein TIFTF001_008054 [Ficus carica]|uniref:Uncharacterized protein n=1 Tax=Ficus carica TaxID=3494 RepID=A0AA88CXN6_FICCA|nr:hypothetical protein TIFTF001_008054 [Ficus carica]
MGPRPRPITPWAPLKLWPETLGPELRNAHPKWSPPCFVSLPELSRNVVVSFEKNPLVVDPDESTNRAVAVVGIERGGVAGEEGRSRAPIGAVSAGRASNPHQIAAGVGDEEELLRRRSDAEVDEVLAGAGGGAGDYRGFDGVTVEEDGEAVGVGGKGFRRRGEGVPVEQWQFEIFSPVLVVGVAGLTLVHPIKCLSFFMHLQMDYVLDCGMDVLDSFSFYM